MLRTLTLLTTVKAPTVCTPEIQSPCTTVSVKARKYPNQYGMSLYNIDDTLRHRNVDTPLLKKVLILSRNDEA